MIPNALTSSGTRSDWTFRKAPVSLFKSLNGWSSAIAASWFARETPALQKQFTKFSVNAEFQAETSIFIPIKIEIFDRTSFFSKLQMNFWTIFLRYLAFRDLITPWSMGCVFDFVFGSKKNNLIDFKFSMWGLWSNYLLLVQYFFFPLDANFRSNSCTHSSNKTPFIQFYCWLLYEQSKHLLFWKLRGLEHFPVTFFSVIDVFQSYLNNSVGSEVSRDVLWVVIFFWGGGGIPLTWTCFPPLNGNSNSPVTPLLSLSRKNLFSTILHNNLNMCFVHTFPMELECTYYLSPDYTPQTWGLPLFW